MIAVTPGEDLRLEWDASALSAHDFIVLACIDLPVTQWYDTMKWWVRDNPSWILHPSIEWACEQRAREMAEFIGRRP
jgi:hypothetical protein